MRTVKVKRGRYRGGMVWRNADKVINDVGNHGGKDTRLNPRHLQDIETTAVRRRCDNSTLTPSAWRNIVVATYSVPIPPNAVSIIIRFQSPLLPLYSALNVFDFPPIMSSLQELRWQFGVIVITNYHVWKMHIKSSDWQKPSTKPPNNEDQRFKIYSEKREGEKTVTLKFPKTLVEDYRKSSRYPEAYFFYGNHRGFFSPVFYVDRSGNFHTAGVH